MPLRRRRPRRATRALVGGGLAALCLSVLLQVPVGALPEPPLVVPADDASGEVRIDPPTQQVEGPQVTWQLRNGGGAHLTFTLALHAVEAATEGATIGDPVRTPALGADRLTLAPGEQARIPVHLSDTTPRALALVATTVDAEPETTVSGLALVGAGGAVTPEIVAADASAGTFTLRLEGDGPALVDVAVRATAWPGRPTTTHRIDGVLVPDGGREVPVRLRGPLVGRVSLEVAVTAGEDVGRDARAVWWWPRSALAVAAGALVVVTLAGVVLVRRRRG